MAVPFLRKAVRYAECVGTAPAGLAAVVAEQAESHYRGRFQNWDRSAAVRRRPLRRLREEAAPGQLYFPPELVPVHTHPLVAALGETARHRLLIHSLYDYLHFTSELEDIAVIPVAMQISRGRSGLALPEEARRDAFKIVTDEAWHAQFSYELLRQIADRTGEPVPDLPEPMFVERLSAISAQLHTHVPALGELLFTVVSETLVSSLLTEIPHDSRLPSAVRETVADHAVDEGRHHAYFHDVLVRLWRALSSSERASVGPWLPSIILAFLEPDYRAVGLSLAALGLSAEQVEAVLTDSYPRPRVLASTAAAARPTIRYFTEVGALRHPATADAFAVFPPG
jgi:hypothetical protein